MSSASRAAPSADARIGRREGDSRICAASAIRYPCSRPALVWRGARRGSLLASCYSRSLAVADEVGARSVAFPAISTGVFGYPPDKAAKIAVTTLRHMPDVGC